MSNTLQRMGGNASIIGGGLAILAGLTMMVGRFIGEVNVGLVFLLLGSALCNIFALVGLFSILEDDKGTAKVGFVLGIIGLGLDLANFFDPTGDGVFLIGLLLMALANLKAKKLPAWGFWLWLGGVLVALGLVILGWMLLAGLALIVSGAGRIWLGRVMKAG